jgi:hypothetical protein
MRTNVLTSSINLGHSVACGGTPVLGGDTCHLTDLAPAQTTATGVLPSSVKSADTSMLMWPPLQQHISAAGRHMGTTHINPGHTQNVSTKSLATRMLMWPPLQQHTSAASMCNQATIKALTTRRCATSMQLQPKRVCTDTKAMC